MRNWWKGAMVLGLLATLTSLSTIALWGLADMRRGYYFWLASILAFTLGTLALYRLDAGVASPP